MTQEYYTLEKTAEILGLDPAAVHQLRERNELRGYRDGPNWKFKADDVQNRLAESIRARKKANEQAGQSDDVLMSEIELDDLGGSTGSATAGPKVPPPMASDDALQFVGGDEPASSGDMDITVADDQYNLAGNATVREEEEKPSAAASDEVDLTLEDDITLPDSGFGMDSPGRGSAGSGSAIDLSEALDDDLVLGGGSGSSGSDITIGSDSGISLVDPSDSGLSLEQPINLLRGGDETPELDEDDLFTVSADTGVEAPEGMTSDADFLLTPLGEEDEEDSASGSEVVALESESEADAGDSGQLSAALDEEFAAETPSGFSVSTAVAAATPAAQAGIPQAAVEGVPYAGLPEAPYTVWNIMSLAGCVLILALAGMMVFDVLRNMWSWQGTYSLNSSLMDMILSILP